MIKNNLTRSTVSASGVDVIHPEARKLAEVYEKMRDCFAGERAIKSREGLYIRPLEGSRESLKYRDYPGERYLPALHDQPVYEYIKYRDRAVWLDATKRTLEFYLALVFGKNVTVEDGDDSLAESIGPEGENLHDLTHKIAYEHFGMGRVGIMVDTTDDDQGLTVAQREAAGTGPFITYYRPEQIINWKHTMVGRRKVLSLVVLEEEEDTAENEFNHEYEPCYRVLRLRDGVYTVQEYNAKGEPKYAEMTPLVNGQPLDYLPFWIVNANEDLTPPLDGVANINIAHYRNTAAYENGMFHVGIPTPYLSGWDDDEADIYLGGTMALVSSNPSFTAGYMEFNGHGLGQLQESLNDKRRDMANLGARLLMDESRFNEAAETVLMRKSGEQAIIHRLVAQLQKAMTAAYRLALEWDGRDPGETRVKINRDLLPASISHQMVVALMNLAITGNISHKVLVQRLKDGEIIDHETDYEDMLMDIEKDEERRLERMLQSPDAEPQTIGRHADVAVDPNDDPTDNHRAGVDPARGN